MTAALGVHGAIVFPTFELRLDLDVAPGTVLGVIGPNGAGKTTLLRAVAGLAPLTTGRITIGEEVIDDASLGLCAEPRARRIGYVFQNYRLFPHLTVEDNIAFSARARGRSRRDARTDAQQWINRFDLNSLATRKPKQLSGGQAQRVALARALAADPDVLLLDEPLAALDAQTRLDTRAELRRHLTEFPGVTLLVTHDPLEAMVLTDRLAVIENGVVVQQGTPTEIARRPETQYVARLVGLNLYTGELADGRVAIDGGGELIVAAPVDGTDRQKSLVAVRPNAITLHTERPEHTSVRNIWHGRIAALELLTDRVRAQVEARPSALVDLTPDAVAELRLAEGTDVWLSVKATDIDTYPRGRA